MKTLWKCEECNRLLCLDIANGTAYHRHGAGQDENGNVLNILFSCYQVGVQASNDEVSEIGKDTFILVK